MDKEFIKQVVKEMIREGEIEIVWTCPFYRGGKIEEAMDWISLKVSGDDED